MPRDVLIYRIRSGRRARNCLPVLDAAAGQPVAGVADVLDDRGTVEDEQSVRVVDEHYLGGLPMDHTWPR
jgi:hypothetical protein